MSATGREARGGPTAYYPPVPTTGPVNAVERWQSDLEVAGDLGGGALLKNVSAQGFVLALLGRFGIEKKGFQVVGHMSYTWYNYDGYNSAKKDVMSRRNCSKYKKSLEFMGI